MTVVSVNERLPTPAGSPETPMTFRESLGRSGSVSLARTLMVAAAWSVVAARSSRGTGGSLAAVNSSSKAPISTPAPWGRATRRWSVVPARAGSPALRAGLSGRKAWVMVGPPLSCSGPRRASIGSAAVPVRSVAPQPLLASAMPIRL